MIIVTVARRPLEAANVAANVLEHGTGALNVDATRVVCDGGSPAAKRRDTARRTGNAPLSGKSAAEGDADGRIYRRGSVEVYLAERSAEKLGRWPANLILEHRPGCRQVEGAWECVGGCPVADLDGMSGESRSAGLYPSDSRGTGDGAVYSSTRPQGTLYDDGGGASRYFVQVGGASSE